MNDLFYRRLKDLIEKSGKSANQIERELGYPRNSLSNYKLGGEPSGIRLIVLSEYFNVSPKYLIGLIDDPANSSTMVLSNEHNDSPPINIFKSLTHKEKKEMCLICQKWLFFEYQVDL